MDPTQIRPNAGPVLRLVRTSDDAAVRAHTPGNTASPRTRLRASAERASPSASRVVEAENLRAAGLGAPVISALDARWALAVRVSAALQPGGLLTPEDRRTLMRTAKEMHLRPFDTNLIIAIVQDAARQGRDPLSRSVQERLTLVAPAGPRQTDPLNIAGHAIAACVLGAMFAYGLCKWIALP
jgi:hypothetical protein